MSDAVYTALAMIAVALVSFHSGRALSKSQRNAVDIKSLIDLSVQVTQLQTKLQDTSNAMMELRNEVDDFEDKNRVLWQYVYALLESHNKNGIPIPPPPADLKTDPKLVELIKGRIDRGET